VRRSGMPGQHRQHRLGAVQRLHLGLLVHPSTSARSGGSRDRPTTSRTCSTNSGSLDSLKVSVRCGGSRTAFQIRPTMERLSPERLAIDARDQWVASGGVSSRVATITASTCSSLMFLGAPGRGASTSPSSRRATTRARHLPTLGQRHPQLRGDLLVGGPGGAGQDDPAAQRQRLGAVGPPRPAPQRLALLVGQEQRRLGSSCPGHPLTLQHFSNEPQAQDTIEVFISWIAFVWSGMPRFGYVQNQAVRPPGS
jgi:hypothetical protein